MDQVFGVSEHQRGDVAVVEVVGEVDVATAPALRACLEGRLAAGHDTIVVDLLGVSFLDSTGLGALVGGMKACRERGGDLRLVVTDPRVMKLFEITGLSDAFSISKSIEETATGGGGHAG